MTAPVPPGQLVTWRMMTALGIHTRDQAREFLTGVVARQLPKLSLDDVRALLSPSLWPGAASEPRGTEVWDVDMLPPRGVPPGDNLGEDQWPT